MERRPFAFVLVALLSTGTALGAPPKEPTVRDKIQGKWMRSNHPYSFQIAGDRWEHWDVNKPFKPTGTGTITYPVGKDYALVKTDTGHTWWLFPAGKNVLASESFEPDGSLANGTDGRVFYRQGTVQP